MMSERGTQIEIEDVLSSIRRLVSQDAPAPVRPTAHRAPPLEATVPVSAPPPRISEAAAPIPDDRSDADIAEPSCLLLTPALRIEDPAPEPDVVVGAEPQTSADSAPVSEDAALPDVQAASRAEDDLDAAWEQAGGGTDSPEMIVSEETPGAEPADLGAELARLENTIAEMEAAVADSGAEFEPEEGDPFEVEGDVALSNLPEDFASDTPADPGAEPDVLANAGAAEGDLGEGDADVDDLMKNAAAEAEDLGAAPSDASVDAPPELLVPEGEVWDAGDALDWSDAEAPEVPAAEGPRRLHLRDAQETPEEPEQLRSSYDALREEMALGDALEEEALAELQGDPEFSGAEAGLLDEEMLRVLVAELIRKELQGTLGERITRNVRKLVRREIQRALMARDYE